MSANLLIDAYNISMAVGSFHRATGVSSKAKLATAMPQRLPAYVTEQTAHDAAVDALFMPDAKIVEDTSPMPRVENHATARFMGLVIKSVCKQQTAAASQPAFAVTGRRSGRGRMVTFGDDGPVEATTPDTVPLTAREAVEEFDAAAADAGLTASQFETLQRMIMGEGCPDDTTRGAWYVRVHTVRQLVKESLERRDLEQNR